MDTPNYIAPIHPMQREIYRLRESWTGDNSIGHRRKLNAMIKEYPDLIDAYNFRYDILGDEDHIVAQDKEAVRAYRAVREHYFPKQYPESLLWLHLENRPLLRALRNYCGAIYYSRNKKAEFMELADKQLSINPSDNLGIRFMYLAFLEGMSFADYMKMENSAELLDWFNERAAEYDVFRGYLED